MADGVGGWRTYGIDPSAFPQSLMNVCLRLIKEGRFHPQSPGRIIEDSYQEILNQKQPLIGEYFMLFLIRFDFRLLYSPL